MKNQEKAITEENLKYLLIRKDYAEALLLTERLLTKRQTDERLLLMIGSLFELIDSSIDAESCYRQIIKLVPCAYNTHLMLGSLYHKRNDTHNAFKYYVYALRTANSVGFWMNQESTAPWARSLVIRAVNFVEQHRRGIIGTWIEEIHELFGSKEVERIVKGIRMYSGEIPTIYEDERQRPSFLYIPGLPAKPVFARSDLSFIEFYEDKFESIKGELDELIEKKVDIENYRDDGKHGLTKGGNWDAKFFFRHGKRYEETHNLCPKTSEVLDSLPLVHIKDHSPEVCFSVLRPGAHLLPHRGVTNSRSVLHMGLSIPENCSLNLVDIQKVHWKPGVAFAFDDNYLHEAWNQSENSRYVLLADIWNPFLSESERASISYFVEKVGGLNNLYPAQKISS